MRTVAIVQARMSSTRLPGKVLLPIEGKPMLWHVLSRTRAARGLDGVLLATTTAPEDRALEPVARELGADCCFGDLNDVLDRYHQAARRSRAEAVVRVTADCPLLDPAVIAECVALFKRSGCDYASNAIKRSYPDGLDVEVFSASALERAWKEAKLASEREHVTPYLWKNPQLFRLADLVKPVDHSAERWCVDKAGDLEFARAVFAGMRPRLDFGMDETLAFVAAHPELKKLNAGSTTNEGYEKSLREDHVVDPRSRS